MADPEVSNTIAGELPIRTAATTKQDESPDSKPKVDDAILEELKDAISKIPQPTLKTASSGPTTAIEEVSLQQIVSNLNKKKKSRRPKSKRGQGKPTGFEPWSCDGPLTPDECHEDRDRYDPDRPFIVRIEDAAIRFEKHRRIEPDRRNIFHKYLAYGGISTADNYGRGVSAQDLKEMSADEAMRARSKIGIHKERDTMEVSFDLVARGFFGAFYGHFFGPRTQKEINLATITISNFLTYLLFHGVCPEYNEDILKARETCNRASKELWTNLQLLKKSPGKFNQACSFLFDGYYFDSRTTDNEWDAPEVDGMTAQSAREILKHGVTFGAAYEVYDRFKELLEGGPGNLQVERVFDIDGFEIVSIEDPAPHVLVNYEQYAQGHIPVGILHAKTYLDPSKPEIDLSPQERWDWDHGKSPKQDLTILIEMDLLELCHPGQKIITDVWEMNCGLHFFDRMTMIYASFYESLYNDRMLQWKAPREVKRPEPAPKEDDSTDLFNGLGHDASDTAVSATNEISKQNEQKKHFEDSDTEFDF